MRGKSKIGYFIYLAIIVIALMEITLRIWNPFHFRIKGDRVVLNINKTYEINNKTIPVLDSHIIHTKNSLGFRGPEKPIDFKNYLSIITIGGSTTENQYLNDGKTWSDQLYFDLQKNFNNAWINNAGMAGHSTFGHIALVEDHIIKLKPKIALFLIGINDIGRNDLNDSDKSNLNNNYSNLFTFLSKESELCNVIANVFRTRRAKLNQLSDTYLDLKSIPDTLNIPDSMIQKMIASHKKYHASYQERIQKLIDLCHSDNILPVFITQPLLLGRGIDSLSKINLESIKFDSKHNGRSFWMLMESYNDITRSTANKNKILLIDAAHSMPKNSLYFYDAMHYTDAGAKRLGDLINDELKKWLTLEYPSYLKH